MFPGLFALMSRRANHRSSAHSTSPDCQLAWHTRLVLIILVLLLNSCSMLRLGYGQGPHLFWWWLDSYVDFNPQQTPQVKEAIQQWFRWHRHTQLTGYATWLANLRSNLDDPATAQQICTTVESFRQTIAPALDRMLTLGAPLIPTLESAQLDHLERRYAKVNEEFRQDFLQPQPAERLQASIQRTVKRVENIYGPISESQHALIATRIQTSPYNPEAWLDERQRRQQETLQSLRQLAAEPGNTDDIVAVLRTLIEHLERSSHPQYRAYQIQLADYNCAFIAEVHNSTTTVQRHHARDKLKNWENDLRMLAHTTHQ